MEKIVKTTRSCTRLHHKLQCQTLTSGTRPPVLFRPQCEHAALTSNKIEWRRHICVMSSCLNVTNRNNIQHGSERLSWSRMKFFKSYVAAAKQQNDVIRPCSLLTSLTGNINSVPVRSLSTSVSVLSSTPSAAVTSSAPISTDIAQSSIITNAPTGLISPDFIPIRVAETAILHIQQLTGLPWWGTIMLTAFLLRVVLMVPLTIHTFHNAARLQRLAPEVKEMAERLRKEVGMAMRQFGWDQKRAKEEYDKNFKRLLKDLYVRDNCHPMKGTAAFWVQLPVWLSVSYALRNMSVRARNPDLDRHSECSGLMEGGTAWFPDLTCTDSTWLLPVLMGTVTLFNIEMNYLNVPEVTKYRRRLTLALRGVALIFIPVSSAMPCAMVLYWVSSGVLAAVQNVVFEYSPFRRLVRLPQSPVESNFPARALLQKAKLRYFKR